MQNSNTINTEWLNMGNKVFLDTNILLDILSSERSSSQSTRALLLKYGDEKAKFVINDLSLNTLYYVGSKTDRNTTFNFMKDITFNNPLFEVYYTKERDLKEVYDYMDKSTNADFEDLLQYAAAKNSGCSVIITNDKNFPKLDIPLIRTNPNIEDYFPNNSNTYISI